MAEEKELKNEESSMTAATAEKAQETTSEASSEQANVCEVVQKSSKSKDVKKLDKKELLALDEEKLSSVKDSDLKVIAELLQEIRNENKREMKYARTQMRLAVFTSFISLVIIIIVAIGVAFIIPRVTLLANEAEAILQQTNSLMIQAETVMDNMEHVTNDLAKADITGMLSDVDNLVTSSEASMSEAMKKVTDIDINSLNQAIKDLGSIVSPLAKLLGHR